MIEVVGNLFEYPCDAVCIPVNWRTKSDGKAVMGAGVAKQAAERWLWLPVALATVIHGHAMAVHAWNNVEFGDPHVVAFPTKGDWRQSASLILIERMARQLVWFATEYGWQTVALPRLGCGERTGRLQWDDVRAVLAPILDDRFHVLVPETEAAR